MIPCKPIGQRLIILFLAFFTFSVINSSAQDGAAIFKANCSACHTMGKASTGPDLVGVVDRWGGDMAAIRTWVKNWKTSVASGNPRAVEVQSFSATSMDIFGERLKDAEIDAVITWANGWTPPVKVNDGPNPPDKSGQNAVIFGVISLILAVVALILMYVNSNLKKMSDDAEGIERPEPVPFYRNKVYIAMAAIVFTVIGGYFVAKGAINMGRQKDYEPEQPIFYSHKVHAGINQINCLYCHGNAMESKHATIPSVNVCMNCHKSISEYSGAPLYRADGTEVNGTAEIAKLYTYAGFDPTKPDAWDPANAKPIQWVKIHNLPDHVYFNHSQHVKAGNVQCQTCHGEITAMDEVKQFSELSMGWCVNCHRQTKVNFNMTDSTGNQFYSIYEKFHEDIRAGKMDSVTVKDIGGLECQKCHY